MGMSQLDRNPEPMPYMYEPRSSSLQCVEDLVNSLDTGEPRGGSKRYSFMYIVYSCTAASENNLNSDRGCTCARKRTARYVCGTAPRLPGRPRPGASR